MELRDILDQNGNKTGKIVPRGEPLAQGEYYLIVDAWILNQKGEFLISKRTPHTQPEPNRWQPTTGGAIAGEDSLAAALREVKEELGLALKPENGRMVKRLILWGHAMIDVWLFRQDFHIKEAVLQPEETDAARWATRADIRRLMADDQFLSGQRVPYVEELFQICEE